MTSSLRPHQVKEGDTKRSILIHPWSITAENHPISNTTQLDDLQSVLGLPLPEMTFGRNALRIKHIPSGWEYIFDTTHSLQEVKNGQLEDGDGGVKVRHAEAWMKSRTGPNSELPLPETVATKPYDWTYTTTYPGHMSLGQLTSPMTFEPADPGNPLHMIPMSDLTRPDPILFYAQTMLFEDELHDNGSSSVVVRVRVMPDFWFLLSRFTLRVDNVLFRMFDTRIYHPFDSSPPLVIRETTGWEAPYDLVKQKLWNKEDLSPLTDPTWIANVLGKLKPEQALKGAETGWKGIGRQVEVARLPVGDDVTQKLKDLHL